MRVPRTPGLSDFKDSMHQRPGVVMTEPVEPKRVPTPLSGPLEQQRKHTITVLKEAFEQDVMNLTEYEERISLALTADQQSELDVLTQDVSTSLVAPAPSTEIATRSEQKTQRPIRAVFGEVQHQGQWSLSSSLRAQAIFGEVRVDLREVHWTEAQALIDCRAVFGSIVIVVPDDVQVDCNGVGVFGSFVNRAATPRAGASHHLTVSGKAIFGSVEVVNGK